MNNSALEKIKIAAGNGRINDLQNLLEWYPNIDLNQSGGWTIQPLFLGVIANSLEAVRMLLEHGADPNIRDPDGNTPLHHAAHYAGIEVTQLLLERGADRCARNRKWRTPLNFAEGIMLNEFKTPDDTTRKLRESVASLLKVES